MQGKMKFTEISALVEKALDRHGAERRHPRRCIAAADVWARSWTRAEIGRTNSTARSSKLDRTGIKERTHHLRPARAPKPHVGRPSGSFPRRPRRAHHLPRVRPLHLRQVVRRARQQFRGRIRADDRQMDARRHDVSPQRAAARRLLQDARRRSRRRRHSPIRAISSITRSGSASSSSSPARSSTCCLQRSIFAVYIAMVGVQFRTSPRCRVGRKRGSGLARTARRSASRRSDRNAQWPGVQQRQRLVDYIHARPATRRSTSTSLRNGIASSMCSIARRAHDSAMVRPLALLGSCRDTSHRANASLLGGVAWGFTNVGGRSSGKSPSDSSRRDCAIATHPLISGPVGIGRVFVHGRAVGTRLLALDAHIGAVFPSCSDSSTCCRYRRSTAGASVFLAGRGSARPPSRSGKGGARSPYWFRASHGTGAVRHLPRHRCSGFSGKGATMNADIGIPQTDCRRCRIGRA